ncbi:hypothetical protein ACTZWT_02415 [Rhodopseudomonas sp. NSM]|uniref:hypothetical protein n=1 Tax=Rhodopseudomonas sp. NSM TaxID=3457630 RepID=UPI00403664AF
MTAQFQDALGQVPDDHQRGIVDRWVRIMCDYSADGVWDKQGRSISAEDLPLPSDIQCMLLGWQEWYEASDGGGDDLPPFDGAAHAAFGLYIARKVKRALPDWTVIYFDESRLPRSGAPALPRHVYEYEIHLPQPSGGGAPAEALRRAADKNDGGKGNR